MTSLRRFLMKLADEIVKHSPEFKSICQAFSVNGCLSLSLVFNFPPRVTFWSVRQGCEKCSVSQSVTHTINTDRSVIFKSI